MIKKYKNKYKNFKLKKPLPLSIYNLHIQANLKNTIISLTKDNGNLLKQWSTKSLKKTKFKKNTKYNVQLILFKINHYIQLKKIKRINIYFKGTGLGRFNILRVFKKKYSVIDSIFDKTPIPFNGCRLKKKRRL